MSGIILMDYMERLTSFSQKAKEEYEDDKFVYYKKLFSFLKAANSDLQAIYEANIAANIAEAQKQDDFVKLQSVFLHSAKTKMLPAGASGYDHCDRLWSLLDLLACDDFENVYRAMPEGLPISNNGYPMYVHGTNILLCLLYNSEKKAVYPVDKIIEKAEKFVASKKPLWERSVISCLLGILQGNVSKISDSLQQLCTGFSKADVAKYMKMQCQCAYGLTILAKHFLSEENFGQLVYPECSNFSKSYMLWFFEQEELSTELCITYSSLVEELNEIFRKKIAITRIHQPYLNSDNTYLSAKEKKAYYMDTDKMLEEFLR